MSQGHLREDEDFRGDEAAERGQELHGRARLVHHLHGHGHLACEASELTFWEGGREEEGGRGREDGGRREEEGGRREKEKERRRKE